METRNENKAVSYKSTHPGEILADWLEDIGVKQKEFAKMIDVPASRLNELIKGKRGVNEDWAEKLGKALGPSSSFWMSAQTNYEYNEKMLALRNEKEKIKDAQEDSLRTMFNLKELYKRFDITAVSSIERVDRLFEALGATYESLTSRTAIVGCFKHSDLLKIDEQNMRTWVLLAQYEAGLQDVSGKYSSREVEKAADEIAVMANKGTLRESDIASILSTHGIRYAVVEKLPGCPVDAYSVMLGGVPAIVVTHRHNNMQKLIFDVLHELGHVYKHMDGDYCDFINIEYSHENSQEVEADEFARDRLIPPATWSKIIGGTLSSASPHAVCAHIGRNAMEYGIDPRIAVARYKHDSREYRGKAYASTKIV